MKDTNLIIGKKNTGKTKYYLFNDVKNAINNNENLCIFDTRDEYFKTFSKGLKNNGYNVLVLNYLDSSKSNGFNPLETPYKLYKEGKIDKAMSLIDNLAKNIFEEKNYHGDPFWANMSINYFKGLVLILFNEGSLENVNLGSIQVMINQSDEQYKDTTYLKKYLSSYDSTSNIYSTLSPTVFAPMDTKEGILSFCKERLNTFMFRDELINMLNTNDIDISKLNNKTAIIIIGTVGKMANVFIDQLVEVSSIPFTYILDNVDSLNELFSLNDLLANASYNKNKVYISAHNLDELRDIYGKYIEDKFDNIVIINNSNEEELNSIGNDNDYPVLPLVKHEYFNLKNIVENMNL